MACGGFRSGESKGRHYKPCLATCRSPSYSPLLLSIGCGEGDLLDQREEGLQQNVGEWPGLASKKRKKKEAQPFSKMLNIFCNYKEHHRWVIVDPPAGMFRNVKTDERSIVSINFPLQQDFLFVRELTVLLWNMRSLCLWINKKTYMEKISKKIQTNQWKTRISDNTFLISPIQN